MTIGFRIARRARSVTAPQVAAFRGLPAANVSDCMSRLTAGGARLRHVHASGSMAGPALTVRTRPGDNPTVRRALDMDEPGGIWLTPADRQRIYGDNAHAVLGRLSTRLARQPSSTAARRHA